MLNKIKDSLGRLNNFNYFFYPVVIALLFGIVASKSWIWSYQLVIGVILIFFIFYFKKIKQNIQFKDYRNTIFWFKALLLYLGLNLFVEIIHFFLGQGYQPRAASFVEKHLQLLVVFMIFMVAMVERHKVVLLLKMLILSSFAVLWVVLYEFYILGLDAFFTHPYSRMGELGSSSVTRFGIFANSLFFSLWSAFLWRKELSRVWVFLLLSALLVTFLGAVLSQTRAAWIGWPEAIIGWGSLYFFLLVKNKDYKKIFLSLISIAFISILFLLSPLKNIIQERTVAAVSDVELYIDKVNPNTSVGLRLVMYEAAINQIKQTPWIGIGENGHDNFFKREVPKVFADKFGMKGGDIFQGHVHNQYLQLLISRGLIGFAGLLAALVALIVIFTKQIKNSNTEKGKGLGVLGMVYVISTMMTFIPDVPFNSKGAFLFLFTFATLLVFLTDIYNQEKAASNE